MLLPKPKKRKKNKSRLIRKQRQFSLEVRGLDGQCMNPKCPCHTEEYKKLYIIILTAHHIIRRGQGGLYVVSNGITFCTLSHSWAEGEGNLKDENGNRMSALQFVLSVLDYWEDKPNYRWAVAHAELRIKVVK